MKKNAVFACAFLLLAVPIPAQQPSCWNNPHRAHAQFMYERGLASDASSEQEGLKNAVLAAKDMLVERIGVVPALREAGLSVSPEFALVNCTVSDSGTERSLRKWSAWVMVKYPQEEKEKILARWNASIASINSFSCCFTFLSYFFRIPDCSLLLFSSQEGPVHCIFIKSVSEYLGSL